MLSVFLYFIMSVVNAPQILLVLDNGTGTIETVMQIV